MNGIPPERRSPIADDQLDSMPASAIDDDGSQVYDKYENSLSVHSHQGYESALPVSQAPAEHQQQQPYENALPQHQQPGMMHHRRLSDHQQQVYEQAHHHQHLGDHRLSEVA
jgi:hypothetical protein